MMVKYLHFRWLSIYQRPRFYRGFVLALSPPFSFVTLRLYQYSSLWLCGSKAHLFDSSFEYDRGVNTAEAVDVYGGKEGL
jgi:hypothetical protein